MEYRKKFKFTYNDMAKRSFSFFEDIWRKRELCDITFRIGHNSVYAHKIIITAAIPYLRDILSNNEGEAISLPNIEPEAFENLVEYSYTSKLEIDMDNAMNILSAACYLRIDEVKEACCDFLAENLDFENVFSIREMACNLNCSELLTSIDCHVRENFYEIVETEQFLKWPFAYLKEIVGGNDLYVDSEQTILEAAIKWVKVCPEERKAEFPDLLREIRLHEVDPLCLVDIVETEGFIRASMPIRDLIDEAKHYHLIPERRQSISSFPTEPRRSMKNSLQSDNKNNMQIIKFSVDLKHSVQAFDPFAEVWHIKGSKSYFTTLGSLAVVKNQIYYFYCGCTLQYDLGMSSWKYVCLIPAPSTCMGAVTSKENIYIFGGKIDQTASNAARCFDPEMDKWTMVRAMRAARWGTSVVSLSEYIFVLGGQDSSVVFDSVERYDPEMDKWKAMQPMLTKRCFAGAASLNGKIYVCGGVSLPTGTQCLASAEVYDPMKNKWAFIKPITSARCHYTLLSCRSKLYAIGGRNSAGKLQHIFEIYDPACDEWTTGPSTDPDLIVCGAVTVLAVND